MHGHTEQFGIIRVVAQVLGLPTGRVRVLTADSAPGARAAGCAFPAEPRNGIELPVHCAPALAAAPQPYTEVGGPNPVTRAFGATCGSDWEPPARGDTSDTSPSPIWPSAQRHSRLDLCEGHPCAAQHGPESVSSLSASSDELKFSPAERCVASQLSQGSDIAAGSKLAVAKPEADANAIVGGLSKQRFAAAGQHGQPADLQARREQRPVSHEQLPQELAQPSNMDR